MFDNDVGDDEWHADRESLFAETLRYTITTREIMNLALKQLKNSHTAWGEAPRVYWSGEVYSKDEKRTYSFRIEGLTKEYVISQLIQIYAQGHANLFKDKWVVKSIERVK